MDSDQTHKKLNFLLIFGAMRKMYKNISTHSAELVVVNKRIPNNLEKSSMLIKIFT